MSTFYAATDIEALAGKLARISPRKAPAAIRYGRRCCSCRPQSEEVAATAPRPRARHAINLKFDYLENGLWDLLSELDESSGTQPQLLTTDAVQLAILAVLLDENTARQELRLLRNYLGESRQPGTASAGDRAARAHSHRRVITTRLAVVGPARATLPRYEVPPAGDD